MLQCFGRLFDPRSYPTTADGLTEVFTTYGDEEVDWLLLEFLFMFADDDSMDLGGVKITPVQLRDDWKKFRQRFMSRQLSDLQPAGANFIPRGKLVTFQDMVHFIFSFDKSTFPSVRILAAIAAVLPAATAFCERGFSFLDGVKEKHRTSLVMFNTNALMYIKMNGPTLPRFRELFLDIVLDTWLGTGICPFIYACDWVFL
jgi:hypothetical protein